MLRRVARGGRFARRHRDEPQSPFETPTEGRPLRLILDPGIFGAKAFALATKTLNVLMAATEVERLVSDPSVLLSGPPEREPGRGFWDEEWHRARYRLLAGL